MGLIGQKILVNWSTTRGHLKRYLTRYTIINLFIFVIIINLIFNNNNNVSCVSWHLPTVHIRKKKEATRKGSVISGTAMENI